EQARGRDAAKHSRPGATAPLFELWINWICGKEARQQSFLWDEPMNGKGAKSAEPTKRVKESSQHNGLELEVFLVLLVIHGAHGTRQIKTQQLLNSKLPDGTKC